MLSAAWIFERFPKKMIITNYIILVIGSIIYSIGFYISLVLKLLPFTLTELIITIMIFVWLFIILRNVKQLSGSSER